MFFLWLDLSKYDNETSGIMFVVVFCEVNRAHIPIWELMKTIIMRLHEINKICLPSLDNDINYRLQLFTQDHVLMSAKNKKRAQIAH